MTLSLTQQVRNRDLIDQSFADAGKKCCFCKKEIDRNIVGLLHWHHVDGPKLGEIWRMFTRASPTKLQQELKKCLPAHRECHNEHHRVLSLNEFAVESCFCCNGRSAGQSNNEPERM